MGGGLEDAEVWKKAQYVNFMAGREEDDGLAANSGGCPTDYSDRLLRARVAALELGADGIRVNTIHPNAVFDTGIWDEETVKKRAANYGLTPGEYRSRNVLGVEITSSDVAAMVLALLGPGFSRTTGAQIPIDGGNERVI